MTTHARLLLGAACCAAAAVVVAVAPALWRSRVELFVLPPLWREVCRLRDAAPGGGGADSGLTPSQRLLELSPLDVAACRLIRAQRRDFTCGRDFTFFALRTDEGKSAWLVQYEPVDTPFDAVIDPDAVEICWPKPCVFTVLDGRGRLLGEACGLHDVHRLELQAGDGSGSQIARVSSCGGLYEFAADARGLVPRGRVTDDALAAPVPTRGEPWRPGGREEVQALLARGREGDLYRALERIEESEAELVDLAAPLLSHPTARLRARAAAVLARDAGRVRVLRPLLVDPSPQVRRSALHSIAGAGGGEAAILPLAADPHPAVAIGAHRELVRSEDPEVAEAAAVALLRAHDNTGAAAIDIERLHSAAIADGVVCWLEADCSRDHWDVSWSLSYFAAADLEPLLPRLAAAYERWEANELPRDDIAVALARLDDPLADDVLARSLTLPAEAEWNPTPEILQAFLERRSAPRTPAAIAALAAIARTGACLLRENGPWCALQASILLAGAGAPGAAEGLRQSLVDFEGEWCDRIFAGRFPFAAPLPPAAIPTVLDLALVKSGRLAATAGGVLSQSPPAELLPHLSPLIDLYRLLEAEGLPRASLAARLATMAGRRADEALAASLQRPWSDESNPAAVALRRLVERPQPPGSAAMLTALAVIAAASEEDAQAQGFSAIDWWSPILPEDPETFDEEEARSKLRPEYLEFLRAVDPPAPGKEIVDAFDQDWPECDWQVAASLILVRAGLPGAVDRLLERVAAPGCAWAAHRALWDFLPPEHLPRLRDAAGTDPARFEGKFPLVISVLPLPSLFRLS